LILEPVAGGFVAWGVGSETALKGMTDTTTGIVASSAEFSRIALFSGELEKLGVSYKAFTAGVI
jgi:hypothetical protein